MDTIRKDTKEFSEKFLTQWSARSVDENWRSLVETVQLTMEKNIPQTKTGKRNNLPWITHNVKRQMKRRDRLLKKAKKKKTPGAWKAFRIQRNATTSAIRQARDNYIHDIIGDLAHATEHDRYAGTKRFFGYIKAQKKEKSGVPTLNVGDETVTTDQGKADAFNKQFKDAFTTERTDDIPDLGPSPHPSCDDIVFTTSGIIKLLKGLKPHKAMGPDGLPPRILKDLAEELAPILTVLFQQIYDTGEAPQDWKDANVVPIYKKDNRHSTENYRPVSLTSVLSKVYEHIIVSATMTHLTGNNILTDDQYGFRSKRSCETALLATIHDWAECLFHQLQVDVIFLDFSKAFDCVPHQRLLEKLRFYGIDGKTNKSIRSLLSGRRQRVLINGTKSDWEKVTSGVPQGSVIGPILFLIYINDIQKEISSSMKLFADDSTIYRPIRSYEDHLILQEDLRKLDLWAEKWQMTFKPIKCKTMNITNKRNISKYGYTVKGSPIETIKQHTYLGVEIDNKLTWTPHINKICKKSRQTLGLVQRSLHAAPQYVKGTAYKVVVRPKLEYASSAWSPQGSTKIKKLESVQRKAARFTTRNYEKSTDSGGLVSTLEWDTLQVRRNTRDATMWYKTHHGGVDLSFPPSVHLKPRRGKNDHELAYFLPQVRVDAYKNSFFMRTISLWNGLPGEVVAAPSVNCFQRQALDHFRMAKAGPV